MIWEWYGGYSEFSKKGAYLLENGLGDIIEGVTTLGIAYYGTRPVKGSGSTASESAEVKAEPSKPANGFGADRAEKYSNTWQSGSVKDAIRKFAYDAEPVYNDKGKIIFRNESTGIEVVYDRNGDYFRIVDTNLVGKRTALDINGNKIPNNVLTEKGTQRGMTQSEYNAISHFNNTDIDFPK